MSLPLRYPAGTAELSSLAGKHKKPYPEQALGQHSRQFQRGPRPGDIMHAVHVYPLPCHQLRGHLRRGVPVSERDLPKVA